MIGKHRGEKYTGCIIVLAWPAAAVLAWQLTRKLGGKTGD